MTPHTTSLEVAKQLTAVCREKGIEMPDSYHLWEWLITTEITHVTDTKPRLVSLPKKVNGKYLANTQYHKAYTLGELMRMLSDDCIIRIGGGYDAYDSIDMGKFKHNTYAHSPEDAAALLLIELIKSGEITSLHVSA